MTMMGDAAVPAFLSKLWALVEDPSTDSMISWDASGTSFHIIDQASLAREELPRYFKHNNIASFIRQLNMYGFRKKMHIEAGGLKVEKDDMEFQHPYFLRGNYDLLAQIKRKITGSKMEEVRVKPDDVSRVLGDVTQIKGRQDNLSSKLDVLKRENEALWREVANLRQRHVKQQQVVNKLIQFLLSLVSTNHSAVPGTKRRLPMLNDSSQFPPSKIPKLSTSNTSEQGQTKTSGGANGTSVFTTAGPTIRDITDLQDLTSPADDSSTTPSVYLPPESVESVENLEQPEPPLNTEEPDFSQSEFVPLQDAPIIVSSNTNVSDTAPVGNIMKFEPKVKQSMVRKGSKSQKNVRPQIVIPEQKINVEDFLEASVPSTSDHQNKYLLGSRSPTRTEVVEDILSFDTNLDSIKQKLATGTLNLDPNILSGLFTPEAPLPATPDHLLESLSFPTSLSPSPQSSGTIVGNEVIQYNPQEPDNILSLFDLGDLSNDVFQGNVNTLPTSPDKQEMDTPNLELKTPSFNSRNFVDSGDINIESIADDID